MAAVEASTAISVVSSRANHRVFPRGSFAKDFQEIILVSATQITCCYLRRCAFYLVLSSCSARLTVETCPRPDRIVYPSTTVGAVGGRYCNVVAMKITSTRGLCLRLTVASCLSSSQVQIYDGNESSRVLYDSPCRRGTSVLSSSAILTVKVTLNAGVWHITPLLDLRYNVEGKQKGTYFLQISII